MSFTDRFVLWLHVAVAIFTVGPVTLAISSTPRSIRRNDVPVLRYLTRITMIFTAASLLVLVLGIVLGQLDHDFARPWLTAAMTLFVVAIVLLLLIIRDQRKAIRSLAPAGTRREAEATQPDTHTDIANADPVDGLDPGGDGSAVHAPGGATLVAEAASVQRGRIAAMGGVVNLIWLAILVLMVWQP